MRNRFHASSAKAPGLIGRAAELGRLHEAIERLSDGECVVLELVGEPGIGKTALLDALCSRAGERGRLALSGRAGQFERDVPYRAFVDALEACIESLGDDLLESLDDDVRVELGRLFPTLAGLGAEQRPALGIERHRAHHAVRSLLRVLTAQRPVVVALDDVHWIDEASQELLSFLLRRPPMAPVLLVLAYRRSQAPARIVDMMDEAVAEGTSERLEIGPLSREAADELLGGLLQDPELRSRAFEESGGNPFYLWQLVLNPEKILPAPTARSGGDGLPASVLSSINGELSALGDAARRVLRGAAIAGDPFEPQLAAAGAELSWEESLGCLDELLERMLIRPGDSPRRFQFRHPIVRRAIYEATPAGWRIGAHARVAARLREEGAPPAALAPHLETAARPGDEDAIAVLAEAGHGAVSRAPASAARWLRSAVELLPAGEHHDARRVALLVPMASALGDAGRLEESRDAMREALAVIPADDREARTRAAVGCATMEFLLRRKDAAEQLLLDTLASLDDHSSPEAADIMFALGSISCFDHGRTHARRWCRKALAIVRHHRHQEFEAGVTALLAYCELRLGNITAGRALARRAANMVDRLADAEIGKRLDALFWLGPTEYRLELFDDALRHAERGIAIARANGQSRWLSHLSVARIWALCHAGRISDAAPACEDVVEMARLTGDLQWQAIALAAAAEARTLIGELRGAVAAAQRAVEVAGPAGARTGDYASVTAHLYLARSLAASGQPGAARRTFLAGCGGEDLALVDAVWKPLVYRDLTLAEVALGDVTAAHRWAACAVASAEPLGLAGRRGWALHARAAAALARGDANDAASAALEAATASRSVGASVDVGQSLSLAGRAQVALGRRDVALRELERAFDLLDECGAVRLRDATARELGALGRRASTNRSGVSALSPREREIADLVAIGKANKEIAAELHLSVYTVENHLRRVFAKLGISKRAAVAMKLSDGTG